MSSENIVQFKQSTEAMLRILSKRDVPGASVTKTLVPEWRTIGKMLKDNHRAFFRKQSGPSGQPWEKLYHRPIEKVGDEAGFIWKDGSISRGTVQSSKQKKYVKAFREKFGPPVKGMKALNRNKDAKKYNVRQARQIFDYLVTNVNTKQAGGKLRGYAFGSTWMRYGYSTGAKFMEELQYGRSAKGSGKTRKTGALKGRELIGMNNEMINFTEKKIADGFQRLFMGGK